MAPAIALQARILKTAPRPGVPLRLNVADVTALTVEVYRGQARSSGLFSSTRIGLTPPPASVEVELPGLAVDTYLVLVQALGSQDARLAETGCLFVFGPGLTTQMGLTVSASGLALAAENGCAQPPAGLAPRLAVRTASVRPVSVTPGGLIALTLTAWNEGDLLATGVQPVVTFDSGGTDVTGWFSVGQLPGTTPAGGSLLPVSPRSLAPGEVTTFEFAALLSPTASAGNVTVIPGVEGDGIVRALGVPQLVTVLAPSNLVFASPLRAPATVSAGQSFVASFTVENRGQVPAVVTRASLLFGGSGVVATARSGNPTSVESQAAAVFFFDASAQTGAGSGSRTALATVEAVVQSTGLDCSSSSALAGGVTVQSPALLSSPGAVRAPAAVSQGQSFVASLTVTNVGEATALLNSVVLSVEPVTGVTFVAGPVPATVAGGASVAIGFAGTVTASAPAGPRSFTIALGASDANSGAAAGSVRANAGNLVVQTPPALAFAAPLVVPATVSRGQSFVTTLLAHNTGQAAALLSAVRLTFSGAGVTATARPSNPSRIPGGQSAALVFDVQVDAAAASGARTATGSLDALDENDSSPVTVPATALASMAVQAPASLAGPALVQLPATVSLGQTFPMTVQLTNAGEALALLDAVTVSLAPPDGLTLTAPTGPLQLASGQTGTYRLQVTVGEAAASGPHSVNVAVTARDGNSNANVSVVQTAVASFAVLGHASLQVSGGLRAPSTASLGQSFVASLTVANAGESSVAVTTAALEFAGGGLSAVARPANPASVPALGTAVFVFEVAVGSAASAGLRTASFTFGGTESGSGADRGFVASEVGFVDVLTPARLAIRTVSAAPATVTQGQTGVAVTVTLANTGQTTATVSDAALTFSQAGYTVTSGVNPAVLAGNTTATFSFTVTVSPGAAPGATTLDATVTARDTVTGADASDSAADTTDSWTVLTPARLAIRTVNAAPATVTQGQTGVAVTVTLANTGQTTATVSDAALTFSQAGYTVTSGVNPAVLAGNTTATFSFTVTVSPGAAPGATALDATVTARDAVTGADASDSAADTADSWTVLTPAQLAIWVVSTQPTRVRQGLTAVPVEVRLENRGQGAATLSGAAVTFSRAGYTVTPLFPMPFTLAASDGVVLPFMVDVSAGADLGVTTLDATATGFDVVTGANAGDGGADFTDSWTVSAPASLPATQFSIARSTPSTWGWVQRNLAVPEARDSFSIAYDSLRGSSLMFGGNAAGTRKSDLWSWDGTTWSQLSSATQPGAREGAALAYDAARDRTVLFGGHDGTNPLADTWEWNGVNWSEKSPPASPPARRHAGCAYDASRGLVVVFGGEDAGGLLADTWAWDGTGWTILASPLSPAPQARPAMTYDPSRQAIVLVGCDDGQTWEHDGASWTPRNPAASPSARCGAGLIYDGARGRAVLFGGTVSGSTNDETWEYDGMNWVEQNPARVPVARTGSQLAYDSARGRTVLFGGHTGSAYLNDTWEYDGTNWVLASPDVAGARPAPPARSNTAQAYDSIRGRTVLFGGGDFAPGFKNDTWEWDGIQWSERTADGAVGSPAQRAHGAMAFDEAAGKTVLFGGMWASGNYTDTWEWTGTAWSQRAPAGSPPGTRQLLTYDSVRHRCVLQNSQTWEWDGTDWTQTTFAGGPGLRLGYGLAYDSVRQRTVLFGGNSGGMRNDLWEYDGTTWTERTADGAPGSPPSRYFGAFAFDSERARSILFGGWSGSDLGDTWQFDGTGWSQLFPATSPSASRYVGSYDSARGELVVFGGQNMFGLVNETWVLPGNRPPSVVAWNSPATPQRGDLVELGAVFLDPETLTSTYRWQQLFGPPVTFSDPASAYPTVLVAQAGRYGFQVVTSDGHGGHAVASQTFLVGPPPPALEVTAVSAAATSVTRGGPSTLVTVTVHNPGTDAVAVDPPALTFNGSPLGYAAIPDPANPGLIAAGTTTTFSFAVTADLSAPLGATVLDASIHAVTWDSGEEVSDPDATTTDSWTVLGP